MSRSIIPPPPPPGDPEDEDVPPPPPSSGGDRAPPPPAYETPTRGKADKKGGTPDRSALLTSIRSTEKKQLKKSPGPAPQVDPHGKLLASIRSTDKTKLKKTETVVKGPKPKAAAELHWSILEPTRLKGSETVKCEQCRMWITSSEQAVKALGFLWHPKCFTCNECKNRISDAKFPRLGLDSFCSKACAKKADEAESASTKVCAECGKALGLQFMDMGGRLVHNRCLTCAKCKKMIRGDYTEDDSGKVFCSKCVK